jgi:hypothetical protein
MRVLHISDVHVDVPFARVPWSDWLGKRFLAGVGYALNRRRHFRRVPEKLAALADLAAEQDSSSRPATTRRSAPSRSSSARAQSSPR